MRRVYYALLIALSPAFAVSGCDLQALADNAAAGSLADQFQTFVGDFARQVLAAWLL